MQQAGSSSTHLRFGVFEADLRNGELTKQGKRLRLQEQPFQLLAMLLERPGELVTREEVRQRLWPHTIVDFDHGLNKAISKIRDALGDSAENPRFIETVARRGYRFLADVTVVSDGRGGRGNGDPAPIADIAIPSPVENRAPRSTGRRTPLWLVGAALAVLLAIAVFWFLYTGRYTAPAIRS